MKLLPILMLALCIGCIAPEAVKQTAQGTDDRAGFMVQKYPDEPIAQEVKVGTAALRKYTGEPATPVETKEQFIAAAKKTETSGSGSTWIWVALAGIVYFLDSDLTPSWVKGPATLVVGLVKKIIGTEGKKK